MAHTIQVQSFDATASNKFQHFIALYAFEAIQQKVRKIQTFLH